jgi:hypothetical protein
LQSETEKRTVRESIWWREVDASIEPEVAFPQFRSQIGRSKALDEIDTEYPDPFLVVDVIWLARSVVRQSMFGGLVTPAQSRALAWLRIATTIIFEKASGSDHKSGDWALKNEFVFRAFLCAAVY